MERKKIFYKSPVKFILIPIGIAALLTLVSYIVMQLWNNLLPAILHVSVITFWQAMGIFILCKILFGFGKGGRFGNRDHWNKPRRMEEKLRNMSSEDRARFKKTMGDRMCHWRERHPGEPHPFDAAWDNELSKPEEQKTGE